MALSLYPYQQTFEDNIYSALERVRSVLGVLPTGGGKTRVFCSMVSKHVGAAMVTVHRKEIVGQISMSLAELGIKHRVVAPRAVRTRIRRRHHKKLGKSFVDSSAQVGVVSVQTLTSRSSGTNTPLQKWLKQVTLAVFDEGHHYVSTGLWAKAVHLVERAKLLFFTATPERADGKGLGLHADGFAEEMVEGPTAKWLVDNGYLSKFKYFAPNTDFDVTDVGLTASGDFNAKAFRERVVASHLVGDVVKHYRRFADRQKAIVFATDVETAEDIAAAFRADGVRAIALSGKTEQGERDAAQDGFVGDIYDVLVNVDLFDEGYDVPAVSCVIMARPTESLAKFLQMIGRGLRVRAGKEWAIIVDAVRNWERGHGSPTRARKWSLDGWETGSRKGPDDTVLMKACVGCTQPYEAYHKACPYCGAVPAVPERRKPEHVDGDLMELDVDALDALMADMQRADMSDDDYRADQIARNLPPIGRGADLKRHQASKYRREVLQELVAWWVGAQPGRKMSEIHRRFFHRFGVDIGTAHTLPAAETDGLIDTIGRRFAEDLTT